MWIARDKNGEVYLYEVKPIKHTVFFYPSPGHHSMMYIGKEIYPELTYENSPKQVELKLIEENVAVAESPLKTFPRVNDFETGASHRR